MDDVGGGGAKVRGESHSGQRINSPRHLAGSASGSIRAVGHRRESPGVSGCKSGDSGSEAGKEISANCRRTTRVAYKIKEIEQVVIMSKHCETYVGLLALPARPCERLVSRPSVKPIHANDVCAVLRLPHRCSDCLREIPIAIPTLCPHWDISAPVRSAASLGPGRGRDRADVAL